MTQSGSKESGSGISGQKHDPPTPCTTLSALKARDTRLAYDDPAFATQYGRGQTWLNVAFFAVKGLWDYGYRETAGQIREFLLDMVYDNLSRGICENYDTVKRVGKFTARFSWSAAFVIEFVLEMRE